MSAGIVISIPTLGRPLCMDWAVAFRGLHPPINFNQIFMSPFGKPVDVARNESAEEALRQNAKYLFFLGDDVIPPLHALRQLIFRMENDESIGVVGGVYCSKCDPPAPLVFRDNGHGSYWDWHIGEYFEVSGLGMDCTLIRVDLFKELTPPYFKTVDSDDFLDGRNNATQWTEDLWFLEKVKKETKWKIMCDSSVMCGHFDPRANRIYSLRADSKPMLKLKVKGNKKIIDIGCGPLYREFDEGIPVRVDIREEVNPDYRCDVRNLPFDNGSFDIVFSSHVLEHFNRSEWKTVLSEWIRLLNPSGELRLILPNIKWAADQIINNRLINNDVLNVLYGAQSNAFDYHYNGLTPEILSEALNAHNMEIVKEEHQHYNMMLTCKFKKVEENQ